MFWFLRAPQRQKRIKYVFPVPAADELSDPSLSQEIITYFGKNMRINTLVIRSCIGDFLFESSHDRHSMRSQDIPDATAGDFSSTRPYVCHTVLNAFYMYLSVCLAGNTLFHSFIFTTL